MQAGFALLEMGAVRPSNIVVTMIKNLGDFVITSMSWYALGFSIAYAPGNAFVGNPFTLIGDYDHAFFFFQSTFACTAITST